MTIGGKGKQLWSGNPNMPKTDTMIPVYPHLTSLQEGGGEVKFYLSYLTLIGTTLKLSFRGISIFDFQVQSYCLKLSTFVLCMFYIFNRTHNAKLLLTMTVSPQQHFMPPDQMRGGGLFGQGLHVIIWYYVHCLYVFGVSLITLQRKIWDWQIHLQQCIIQSEILLFKASSS